MSSFGLRFAASTSRTARVACRSCRIQSRALHKRKELSYPVEEGLGTFLPPPALKMIAVDYQQGLLDRLNDQVRGTALENKSIVQTIIDAARDPDKILEFNYASEALNNSFFLENLKPPPANATSHEAAVQSDLNRRIKFHYGSFAHFQSNVSAAVLGMFSTGYVWFVVDQLGQLGVVPTFGTGTLLVRSSQPTRTFQEWQRLFGEPIISFSEDDVRDVPHRPISSSHLSDSLPTTSSPLSGMETKPSPLDPHTPARSVSYYARPQRMYDTDDQPLNHSEKDPRKIGDTLYPLFCVSVHEHAWVSAGYGVWGKEEYMKRFWSVVDWEKVNKLYERVRSARME